MKVLDKTGIEFFVSSNPNKRRRQLRSSLKRLNELEITKLPENEGKLEWYRNFVRYLKDNYKQLDVKKK